MTNGSADDQRRALVVEDDDFTRGLLATAVEALDFEVAQASSAAEALAIVPDFDLDIALIDLDLGEGPNGIDVLKYIRHEAPWAAGIILTSHRSMSLVAPGVDSLEAGYIHVVKADIKSSKTLATAIDAAIANVPLQLQTKTDEIAISSKQAEILRLIADGCSNEEIARRIDMTTRSVERLTSQLYRTLGLHGDPNINARVKATRLYASGKVIIR